MHPYARDISYLEPHVDVCSQNIGETSIGCTCQALAADAGFVHLLLLMYFSVKLVAVSGHRVQIDLLDLS
jgi:hypothetical protein